MVIGIGGISNAGKSTLASKLKNLYDTKKVAILCQDDYVFPKDKIPLINDHIDWERPESIDFKRYYEVVQNSILNNDIVIIEGIFAFHDQKVVDMMDKKIFLTLDQKFFFMRKSNDLRWGKEPDWYMEHIWDSHIKYRNGGIPKDAMVLRGGREINIEEMQTFLNTDEK